MLNRFTIAQKLPALFALLTTIAVVSVGVLSYNETSKAIRHDVIVKLSTVEQTINHEIELVLKRSAANMRVMAASDHTVDAVIRLGSAFDNIKKSGENPTEFLQNSYIKKNPYGAGERHLADTIEDGTHYSKFHAKYHGTFRTAMLEYGFYDIFLINDNGDIIYSVYKENDFAENIESPFLRNSGLAEAVHTAEGTGKVSLTGFQPYGPSNGALAAFTGVQILDKFNEPVGTLVAQLLPDPFISIMKTKAGFDAETRAFVLGSDDTVKFSTSDHGIEPNMLNNYFVGSEIVKEAAANGRGVVTIIDPVDGRKWKTAYGVYEQAGVQTTLIWQVDYAQALLPLYTLRNRVVFTAIVTTIVMTLIGFVIARSISNPLRALQQALQRFVQTGDLTTRVGTKAMDEVGFSTRAVDAIMKMTQKSMIAIKEGSDTAAEAAEKMQAAAKIMASNAETQSSSVEELSSSVEQTESQVRSNAEAAKEANTLVVNTTQIVEDGKEKINRMVDSMDRIKQSSADIAKIIKVIDEIAFQTNLLALNAAVEAARAGQHGRGFAVVAAEVRNLAGRSAKAAQETSELIVGSSKRVEAGVEVSSQAREAFDKIADDIGKVNELVGKISMASDEQARGVTYINRAIQEISDSAMTNAVRAEELTIVANELSESNGRVRHQIATFELGPEAAASKKSKARSSSASSAPASKAPKSEIKIKDAAPAKSNAAAASKSKSSTDNDERGFGRY